MSKRTPTKNIFDMLAEYDDGEPDTVQPMPQPEAADNAPESKAAAAETRSDEETATETTEDDQTAGVPTRGPLRRRVVAVLAGVVVAVILGLSGLLGWRLKQLDDTAAAGKADPGGRTELRRHFDHLGRKRSRRELPTGPRRRHRRIQRRIQPGILAAAADPDRQQSGGQRAGRRRSGQISDEDQSRSAAVRRPIGHERCQSQPSDRPQQGGDDDGAHRQALVGKQSRHHLTLLADRYDFLRRYHALAATRELVDDESVEASPAVAPARQDTPVTDPEDNSDLQAAPDGDDEESAA